MNRRWLGVVGVALAGLLGWGLLRWGEPPPEPVPVPAVTVQPPPRAPTESPTAHAAAQSPRLTLRRGRSPTRTVPLAPPVADGAPEPGAPRAIDLDDLDAGTRSLVTRTGLDHLHSLVNACAGVVSEPVDVGMFVHLDDRGVAQLSVAPVDPGVAAPVDDRWLSDALASCLDDALWAQDWSEVAAVVPSDAALAFALTARLEADADPAPH